MHDEYTTESSDKNEINLRDVISVIFQYKRSILSIILFMLVLVSYVLYFKVPLYTSYAMIEVKSDANHEMRGGDYLGSAFANLSAEKIAKDIEILKTFHVNDNVINKVNLKTRYYVYDSFRKIELYNHLPLEIEDLKILDRRILGKIIKLSPVESGYSLEIKNKFNLFGEKDIELDSTKIYAFDEPITTKYFECIIEKETQVKEPIYVVITDNNHAIYNGIIQNLEFQQINIDAPLIRIAYTDSIPARANLYVNTLIDSFIEQSVADKSKRANRIIDFIDHQIIEIKQKLQDSEDKLEQYRIEYKAIDPTLQAQSYISELSRVEIELSKNKLNKILVDNLLIDIKNNKDIDTLAPLLMQLDDQSTLNLITKLQDAQIESQTLKSKYSRKHPNYIVSRRQILLLKRKIKQNIKNLRLTVAYNIASLNKLQKAYEDNLKSLPTQEKTLINLKRNHKVSSETYEYLLRKKSENEMLKVAILSDYRVVDRAYNSGYAISPKYGFILLVGLILGLIFGVLQAWIRNALDNKIHTKKDVENLTKIPIFGLLPQLEETKLKLEVFKNPKSPFTESYRSLRTNLQFMSQKKLGNVVLVTSSIQSEGKSTTAANLGAIFNMAGLKTLVINLDLRKPALHNYFDVSNTLGMSAYLSGKANANEIIMNTAYPDLDIIPSGPIPPNPSELILSEKLEVLIDELKTHYHYIIIDSAPLALVTDTMQLIRYADMNLVLVRAEYSIKPMITDLNKLVKEHTIEHVGIVMNCMDLAAGSYGYGYGYGYE